MEKDEFMREYLSRFAFSLAQFWGQGEELPDEESREDDIFYRVAIRRLSVFRRAELAQMMWALVEDSAMFFSKSTQRQARVNTIRSVIQRFPLLADADHERTYKNDQI